MLVIVVEYRHGRCAIIPRVFDTGAEEMGQHPCHRLEQFLSFNNLVKSAGNNDG
jgi:hypothetical protein